LNFLAPLSSGRGAGGEGGSPGFTLNSIDLNMNPKPPTQKPDPNLKQIGNLMIYFCVGMAYFNAFSTLNLDSNIDPTLSAFIALGPIVLFILWKRRQNSALPPKP
jgi:hypothetical protein